MRRLGTGACPSLANHTLRREEEGMACETNLATIAIALINFDLPCNARVCNYATVSYDHACVCAGISLSSRSRVSSYLRSTFQ